jgi:superfamily II helicase
MTEKVHKHKFVDEIRVCPMCGYHDGFHNMFKRDGTKIRWLFICSSCHEIFDFGLDYEGPFNL